MNARENQDPQPRTDTVDFPQTPFPPPQAAPPVYAAPGYAGFAYAPAASRPCFACGREWGNGRSCQFCRALVGLPAGVQIASPGSRLGGYLLEGVLCLFTLGIGWLIWSFAVYGKGQTPAKRVLGMRVVDVRTGAAASWGTMFLREFIVKPVLAFVTVGVADMWLLWDKDNQELWDKMLSTVVVSDPNKQLERRPM